MILVQLTYILLEQKIEVVHLNQAIKFWNL